MTLAITEAQAQQAEQVFTQGGVPALWEYLASLCDNYADDAHLVLTDSSSRFSDCYAKLDQCRSRFGEIPGRGRRFL